MFQRPCLGGQVPSDPSGASMREATCQACSGRRRNIGSVPDQKTHQNLGGILSGSVGGSSNRGMGRPRNSFLGVSTQKWASLVP